MAAGVQVLPKETHTDGLEGFYELIKWLTGEHSAVGGSTGSEWTVIECDDGSRRDTPSGGSKLANINSANDWSTGNANHPTAGSWIVIESADANNTNHCQVYVHFVNATTMGIRIIPLEDWESSTDYGDSTSTAGSAPDFGSVISVGSGSGTSVTFVMTTTSQDYTCVCDEGMFVWFSDPSSIDVRWIYVGELDPMHPNSTPADDRCYVIFDTPDEVSWEDSSAGVDWNRLSPVDDTTVLTAGSPGFLRTRGSSVSHLDGSNTGTVGVLENYILPVPIWFGDSGHQHFAGWCRNCYMGHGLLGSEGTLGQTNPDYYYRQDATNEPAVVVKWDGSTVV